MTKALPLLLLLPLAWGRVLLQAELQGLPPAPREEEVSGNTLREPHDIDRRDSEPLTASNSSPVMPEEEKLGEPLSPEEFNHQFAQHDPVITGPSERGVDPIELAQMFEGDIRLGSDEQAIQMSDKAFMDKYLVLKNAVIKRGRVWPDGVIPYTITAAYDKNERGVIALAIKTIQENTCIQIVPRINHKNYIHFTKGQGCSSLVGFWDRGEQQVTLGEGCMFAGVVMHEIMHAAGFWHEQSRSDRDDYIQIHWDNIRPEAKNNFLQYDWTYIAHLNQNYDLDSIMHYGRNSFAIDRSKDTITPINGAEQEIGQRRKLSKTDIVKLNILYKCDTTKTINGNTTANAYFNGEHCDHWAQSGECKTNPKWMLPNCAQSCSRHGCDDYDDDCSAWAAAGECTKNPSYMLSYCRKSCELCRDEHSDPACRDDNPHCAAWASNGDCNSSDYVAVFCRRSCRVCGQ